LREIESTLVKPQAGDAGAWRDRFLGLYEEYLPKVFRYISYRTNDTPLAEDLTSEVFEKALDKLDSYRPEKSSLSTWLFTIARNTVIDHYRRSERKKAVPLEDIAEMKGTRPSPEQEYERREEQERLKVCLAALSAKEQEIVSLKFGSELNNRQIADMLGLSESNVGTILYRSIRRLRDCFGGWQNE
jgi:RNA polymerase sigma-70 factor (ECF subfamily)